MSIIKVNCWDENCKPRPFIHKLNVGGVIVSGPRVQMLLQKVVKEFMQEEGNSAEIQLYGQRLADDHQHFLLGTEERLFNDDIIELEKRILEVLNQNRMSISDNAQNDEQDDEKYIPVVCPNQHLNYVAVKKDKK